MICLLISDLIQSVSGITQVKWAMENRIYEGHTCSLQGKYPFIFPVHIFQHQLCSGIPRHG